MDRVFLAYGTPLEAVPYTNYLGQTLLSSDNNWLDVEQNLQRSWGKWGQLVKILGREGAYRIMAGRFYVVVVQAVLILGS